MPTGHYPRQKMAERVALCCVHCGGTFYLTAAVWASILDASGHKCLKCGSPSELQMDHIIPVALGGKTEIDNVQVLCRPCNQSKGASIADYRQAASQARAA